MAIDRNSRYPGRFDAPTTARPQGAFKNRSAPNAKDGSYLERDWANDWDGFFGSLLRSAGMTANGTPDTALSSQYFDALRYILPSQATETALGISALSTDSELMSGTSRIKVTTPSSLKFGFQILKAETGYIKFPSWLGGLIIQWTKTPVLRTDIAYEWIYPISFSSSFVGTSGMFIGTTQGTLEVVSAPTLTSARYANGLFSSTPGQAYVFAWGF